jgi:hypothetical protein
MIFKTLCHRAQISSKLIAKHKLGNSTTLKTAKEFVSEMNGAMAPVKKNSDITVKHFSANFNN